MPFSSSKMSPEQPSFQVMVPQTTIFELEANLVVKMAEEPGIAVIARAHLKWRSQRLSISAPILHH